MPRKRRNGILWETDEHAKALSAVLFVGHSIGKVSTWTTDQVRDEVAAFREAQGRFPDLSHITQGGVFTGKDGERVKEGSTQVVIYEGGSGLSLLAFWREMVELAEHLCNRFQQEQVIVDVRDHNVSKWVGAVTPDGEVNT